MKQSSRNALSIAAALIVGYVAYRIMFPAPKPDRIEIQNQITSIVAAAQAKNVGGIMASISPHYSDDNGFGSDGLRLSLTRAFNSVQTVELAASPSTLTFADPSTAKTTTYVSIKCQGNQGSFVRPQSQIELDWKKEDTTRYLFFPVKQWRIVRASYGSYTFDL